MSFANSWGKALPPTYRNVQTSVVDTSYDDEFNKFVAERQAKKAEETAKQEAEAQPTEAVTEEAHQAFVEEAEKPKSKKKKKTEAVVEETSDETPVVED